jgi:ribonuclease BN (tRNA processing enzyme)
MSEIKILGAYGGRGKNQATTTIQLNDHVVIDAGNILNPLGQKAKKIDHIFLTHCHLDHIVDLPFLIDAFFEKRTAPLHIYALPDTVTALKKHILNWDIWPDFNEIELINTDSKSLLLHPVAFGENYTVEGITLKPMQTNHTVPSCGYVVTKEDKKEVMITADTYICDTIWDELNSNTNIKTLVIECSFPSNLSSLAEASKHLTPLLLSFELKKLQRDDVDIYINHMKPDFVETMKQEFVELGLSDSLTFLTDGDTITL